MARENLNHTIKNIQILFKNKSYLNSTTLSSYVWEVKTETNEKPT